MSKKIAIINDISGYGRCSISVIQPIVSHLGIQGCPVPTAIFSNHTGFPSFYRQDFTSHMQAYIDEWKKLQLEFDGIMTGFLGSARQIDIVEQFIKDFRGEKTLVLVDPVMGDNGHIYPTYNKKMCEGMKRLLHYADIITPNLTEACFLTDTPYRESGWKHAELEVMARQLQHMGARTLVITGIKMGENYIGNAVCNEHGEMEFQRQAMVEQTRSGTGDVFASVLGADAVNGIPFPQSVKRASNFVKNCLIETNKTPGPTNTGIDFESQLWQLRRK
ncbi:MAG: pyridoxamine kinase [Bacteroidales bacterium]|nr:pyridoxamine kinase [Bacteroidales bacterium]